MLDCLRVAFGVAAPPPPGRTETAIEPRAPTAPVVEIRLKCMTLRRPSGTQAASSVRLARAPLTVRINQDMAAVEVRCEGRTGSIPRAYRVVAHAPVWGGPTTIPSSRSGEGCSATSPEALCSPRSWCNPPVLRGTGSCQIDWSTRLTNSINRGDR